MSHSGMSRAGFTWPLWLALGFLLTGCGMFSGVTVETAKTIATPPSNIVVLVAVEEHGGPVDYLDEGNFILYENDVRLNSADVGLRLVPRDSLAAGHAVLLLDLSNRPDAAFLKRLTRGAEHFVEKVSVTQSVTVLAFDGSKDVRKVGMFPRVTEATPRSLPDLSAFASSDSSRDLNGALVQALRILQAQLKQSGKEVQLGTLLVHTQGPDLAGRKSEDDVDEALRDLNVELYALSPVDVDIPLLGLLGRDGAETYKNGDDLPLRLQDLGMRVRKAWGRHYLLSYCSPARAGDREVTIKVEFTNAEGTPRSGSGSAEFNADEFEAGCTPAPGARPSVFAGEDGAPPAADPAAAASGDPATDKPAAEKKPHSTAASSKKPTPAPAQPAAPAAPAEDVVAPPTSGKYK